MEGSFDTLKDAVREPVRLGRQVRGLLDVQSYFVPRLVCRLNGTEDAFGFQLLLKALDGPGKICQST